MDPRPGGLLVLLLLQTSLNPALPAEWTHGAEHYGVDQWTTENGLPQNTVDAITQTQDGYLWIGTRFGLARFDGIRFTVFHTANTPILASDSCLALVEDSERTLWIGTDGGLLSHRDGQFKSHPLSSGPEPDKIWSLCTGPETGVWIASDLGLFHFADGEFERFTPPGHPQPQVQKVCSDGPGRLLVLIRSLGYQWFDTRTKTFSPVSLPGAPPPPWDAATPHTPHGQRWIATDDQLHLLSSNGLLSLLTPAEQLPTDRLVQMFADSRGTLWLAGHRSGLLCYDGTSFNWFGIGNKRHNHLVGPIFEDQEGNIWIGTGGDGLFRLQRRQLSGFSTHDGILDPQVWSICPRSKGGVWVGSSGGLNSIINGTVRSYEDLPNGRMEKIRSVYETRDGTLWIGSHSQGIRHFKDNRFIVPPKDSLLGTLADIRVLYQDRDGDVWISHNKGLLRQRETPRNYTIADGLSSDDVRVVLQDQDGSHWIGTYENGLCHLKDDRITRHELSNNKTWALHQDQQGTLWIGTAIGLIRHRAGVFSTITSRQGLKENLINQILEDDQGRFWLSGLQGIYSVYREQLDRVADGSTETVHCVAYGVADGMLSTETNGENQPAGSRSPDGHLWFPTTKGVVAINPKTVQPNRRLPPVVIESIEIDDEPIPPIQTEPHRLAPGRARSLKIRYTATSLVAPAKVMFKYRLSGHNASWVEAEQGRVAYFTNLRPGAHRFEVMAANNHGYWNPAPATFDLFLKPHFYQAPLFYVLCFLALAAAAGFAVQIRFRVLKRIHQLRTQHDVDVERSRIAQDLHDGLGSSLTQVALLSELAARDHTQPALAKPHIDRISQVTRGIFDSLDALIWAADPRHDTVEGLINHASKYARNYLETGAIRCRFETSKQLTDQHLPAQVRHHLFLVIKEALHNVLRHSGATEVWIRVQLEGSSLRIMIEDNGRGLRSGSTHPIGSGNGLANMHKRIKTLNGRLAIQDSPSGGVSITFAVDLHS